MLSHSVRARYLVFSLIAAAALVSASTSTDGIYRTDWVKIDRATYDSCIDPRDYRPKKLKP